VNGYARSALTEFPDLGMISQDIAITSAINYRTLRAKGITVRKTIDCLIATFCIENALTLLHTDRDFDSFETHLNLTVWHPAPVDLS
jgi:predicted nucleic acid-binding protein